MKMISLKTHSKPIITLSTTISTPIAQDETFGDTLGEKIILASVGSFVTAVTGYVLVCIFKYFRNDQQFKVFKTNILRMN